MRNEIYFYGGGYNCLSNFAAYRINYAGREWTTAEHAYQAQKFTDKDIQEEIRQCSSAYAAKKLAREYEDQVREDWHDVNVGIMKDILEAKLAQHPHIQEKLKASQERELIEDSDDRFWGRGKDGDGDNRLGKLWMDIRANLS